MPAPKLCPKCQRPVDGNAPHELCPACLLEAMMHEGAAEKPGEQPRPTVNLNFTAPLTEQPGDRIGRYKLREMVGEGGFGVVYVAEQEKPVRRLVALKVIKLGMDTREVIARFEAERQALALMDHPNIAKVLDAGATDAGRPYFVMELVKGIPVTTFCDQHNLTTDDRLGLFIQVCQAIQHAHQKGIIHRDIKPSNILVTSHDGVPVPKVIDFGIAKATQGRLTDLTVYTELNQFMGTPAYMSPEQAELSGLDIDTRTDIYALGVLLYQLLTGKTPFDPKKLVEAGLDEIRRTIREVEPPKPSTRVSAMDAADQTTVAKHRQTESGKLTSLLRGDLDWIVMKCLEKDRQRRYETANGLAADIKRHLDNEPVIARPPSVAYRFQKAVRRNKLAFTAASAVAAALVIGIISSSWLYFRESKALQRAVTAEVAQGRLFTEAQTARTNEMSLRQQQRERLVRVNVASGLKSQEQGDLLSALPRYVEALKLDQGRPKEEHIHRLRIAGVLDQSPKLVRMWFHDGPVLQAEFSHNGRLVLTTDKDGTARVWSLTNETAIAIVRHRGPVLHAAFSPDDGHIATASADGTARIWDTATGAPVTPPLGHTATVNRVSFSPDGRRLLTASDDFTARIWNATNGTEVFPPLGHGGEVRDAAFSPDGQYFATLNQDTAHNTNYAMRLWQAETAEEVGRFRFGDFAAFSVNFSSDGRYLVGSALSHVQVVSVAAKRTIARMNPGLDVYKAVFSEDGDFVLSGGANQTACLWNTRTGEPLNAPVRHSQAVTDVSFGPGGRTFVTASLDGGARLWNAKTFQRIGPMLQHASRVVSARISADGRFVLTASWDGTARLWDLAGVEEDRRQQSISRLDALLHFSGSPDGKRLVSSTYDGVARIWNADSFDPVGSAMKFPKGVSDASFSPEGARVVIAGLDGQTRVCDPSQGRLLFSLMHTGPVLRAAFTPDGAQLLTASAADAAFDFDRRRVFVRAGPVWIQRWDAASGKLLTTATLDGASEFVEFNHSRRQAVTAGPGNAALIWDTTTGRRLSELRGSAAPITLAHFSPDDRLVVSSCDRVEGMEGQSEARVWDTASGAPHGQPLRHQAAVNYAKFSHDSRLVLTVSRDGTVGLWNTEGRPTTPPLPHGGTLLAVDFSPDDLVLATGATDGTARFWDTATGELISSYRHEAMVNHLFYSADGQSLFSGLYNVLSEDGPLKPYTVEVWKIPQETRALAWLEGLAELASGWRNRSGAELTRLTTGDLKKNWLTLRAQHEEAFAVSPERSLDWHLRQGRDAERAADWKLAAMHLQTVLDARPDTGLIDDLAKIRLRLPSGTNAAALFPLRDPTTEPHLIDLTRYYNAALTESWQQRHAYLSNDLSSLPAGQQSLAGVAWDIRGIIQVTSQQLRDVSPPWPAKVENISIGQVCQRLHFLHSACFDRSKPLQTIGQYLVRFEDGSEVEVPIVLGKDVLDWVVEPEAHMPAPVVAWVGQNT